MRTSFRFALALTLLVLAFGTLNPAPSMAQSSKSNQTAPYEVFFSFDINQGDTIGSQSLSIPTGKRFVVEHVTAYVSAPSGDKPIQFAVGIRPQTGGASYSHQVIPVFLGANPATPGQPDRFAVSQLVRWYSFRTVDILVERTGVVWSMSIRGTITGYLE